MSDFRHDRWPWANLFDWQETCWCPASSSPTLRCWSASPAILRQPCTVSTCSSPMWAAVPCPGTTFLARCISTLPISDRKASTGDNNFQEKKQANSKPSPIFYIFVVCKDDNLLKKWKRKKSPKSNSKMQCWRDLNTVGIWITNIWIMETSE